MKMKPGKLHLKIHGDIKPRIIKTGDSLTIYPNAQLTTQADENCRNHGGHEPVIIIVDRVEVTIDPGGDGVTICDGD